MELRIHRIPLADLECVTSTIVKIGGPTWYLNIRKGKDNKWSRLSFELVLISNSEAVKVAQTEFSPLCSSWTQSAWDELELGRVKELQIREVLHQRQVQAAIAQSCECLQCPEFLQHVSLILSGDLLDVDAL